MGLFSAILKKLRRRSRTKGSVSAAMSRPGRNHFNLTAVDLWKNRFRFRETPALRAGTKRRIARERKAFRASKHSIF